MKKLALFFAAVVITAFSSNVFGQGTGTNPAVGSQHNYSVADVATSAYVWDVTSDVEGTTTVVGSVATIVLGGTAASVEIKWIAPVASTIYYVHITETDTSSASGCSNRKVLAVQPANFEMFIENYDLALTKDTTDNFSICAATVLVDSYDGGAPVDSTSASSFTYNYQKDSLYYRVYPTGIEVGTTSWTPVINSTPVSGATVTQSWSTNVASGYTAISGGTFTVTDGSAEVWVKVVFNNTTTNEGTTAGSIAQILDISSSAEGGATISNTPVSKTQNIKARPATTGISTDF